MTEFDDSPGYVLIKYQNGSFPHHAKIKVIPSTTPVVGAEPLFTTLGNGNVLMSTCIDAWITIVRTVYDADTTFISAEFWSKPTPADDPVWCYEHPINVTGNVVGNVQLAGEMVFSFRTFGGHLMKLYFMDFSDQIDLNVRAALGTIGAGANANIRDYVLSDASWLVAKDNSHAVAPLYYNTKMNDVLRRKEILGV